MPNYCDSNMYFQPILTEDKDQSDYNLLNKEIVYMTLKFKIKY